ncbi:MAG: hypothetical protein ACXWNC_02660 [Anaerolineales bacterium]
MITQMVAPDHFDLKAKEIKARLPTLLSKWGLLPGINHWQLAQDPDSGMVVLFANLNTRYKSTSTGNPVCNYCDPLLLHDLEDDLRIQVVSCINNGPRYAFILDQGEPGKLPAPIDFPFLDGDRLFLRTFNTDEPVYKMIDPQISLSPLISEDMVGDRTLVHQLEKDSWKVIDEE